MKRMYIAHTISAALTVALMMLPFGVNCYYASSTTEGAIDFTTVQSLSFFDIRLFEFQNVLPFLAAIAAVILLVISSLRLGAPSLLFNRISAVLSGVVLVLIVLPLFLYGTEYFTTVAMAAAFLALCMAIVDVCVLRGILLYTPRETNIE